MPRRIAAIATYDHTSRILAGQLRELLGPDVMVTPLSFESGLSQMDADVVAVSSPEVSNRAGPWLAPSIPVVTIHRTLPRAAWERVMALPLRTRVLLVNDTQETAVDMVALLHELGAVHLRLTPYWPGVAGAPHAQVAVTPGEAHLVPPWVAQVIDVGPRVLDPSTVIDLLTVLNLFNGDTHRRLVAYSRTVMGRPGLRNALGWLTGAKAQLEGVLDAILEGVVAYDGQGLVTLLNRRAELLLGREGWQLVGHSLTHVAAEAGLDPAALADADHGPLVADLSGRKMVVRNLSLEGPDGPGGGILVIRDVTEIQELERRLRQDLKLRGHVTRYSFADIVGSSPALRATVLRAQKLTPGNGSILVIGESGTGKELFAQAIHAASPRARYPFVAVNCAAVPEHLLESELFGYEDGAFTGARRGGKEGLFEQAHMGSIFLDEIGDLSPTLQGRLLRVLQEKEVLRVGGTRLRPVDVRVICATNRDLVEMVRANQFRADLYYRLNVLTLQVPPLRDWPADIPDLVRHFLAALGDRRPVPDDVMAALMAHDWPGNVRELRNCVEYMVHVADGPFTRGDLPAPIAAARPAVPSAAPLPPPAAGDPELHFLLSALAPGPLSRRCGRRTLARQAARAGLSLTEAQVRHRLEQLAAHGLVRLAQGAPPTLTPAGRDLLAQLGHDRATGR